MAAERGREESSRDTSGCRCTCPGRDWRPWTPCGETLRAASGSRSSCWRNYLGDGRRRRKPGPPGKPRNRNDSPQGGKGLAFRWGCQAKSPPSFIRTKEVKFVVWSSSGSAQTRPGFFHPRRRCIGMFVLLTSNGGDATKGWIDWFQWNFSPGRFAAPSHLRTLERDCDQYPNSPVFSRFARTPRPQIPRKYLIHQLLLEMILADPVTRVLWDGERGRRTDGVLRERHSYRVHADEIGSRRESMRNGFL